MITRGLITFDIEREGRWYHILIPNGAHYKEAQEVMAECMSYLQQQQEAAKKAEEEKSQNNEVMAA